MYGARIRAHKSARRSHRRVAGIGVAAEYRMRERHVGRGGREGGREERRKDAEGRKKPGEYGRADGERDGMAWERNGVPSPSMQQKSFRPEDVSQSPASGRETATSATITRTASTATPTLQCDVAIPTGNSPWCGRDAQGADETDFRGTFLRIVPPTGCRSTRETVSKAVITLRVCWLRFPVDGSILANHNASKFVLAAP
ncbi:hypothetical protein ALC56_04394 [Trachymyrmex septentrionalis]|uniref:Uncharacterized protein n=1 Tax=Trachymyrmex septentrionalis TaxID=34720 RepID=A0A195FLF4_9HYME|nr:hypothetical protein ALC56_04394 [Trachymyrmex septentrionalis]